MFLNFPNYKIFNILKMKKLTIILSLVAAFAATAYAQDEAILSHYLFNPTLINPGATGFSENHNVFAHFRNGWTGFPDAPKTYAISYNGPMNNNLGLGAMVFSENIAQLNRIRGQLSYSFRYKLGDDFKMGIGLSTQIQQTRLLSQTNNTLLNVNDLVVQRMMDGVKTFDASIGVFGSLSDKFYFGVSLPGLVSARLSKVAGSKADSNTVFSTFQIIAGYKYVLGDITLEPVLMVGQVRTAPFQADLSLRASFLNEVFMAGLVYKAYDKGAVGVLLGTKFNGFRLIYSYDYSLQKFQEYNSGGHEFTVGYEFSRSDKKFDRQKKYRN